MLNRPIRASDEALIQQIGRKVGGDEGDVEAAYEEAAVEQPEVWMPRGGVQRHPQRAGVIGGTAGGGAATVTLEAEDGQQREQQHHAEGQHGAAPAEQADQRLRQRHHGELAERAAGGDQAKRGAALLGAHPAAHGAHQHHEGGARQADADKQPERRQQALRQLGAGRPAEADGVDQAADQGHPTSAVAIRQRADKGLHQAKQQVLQGDGEAEGLAADAEFTTDRRHEQAEALSHAHADGDQEAGAGDGQQHVARPGGGRGGGAHGAIRRQTDSASVDAGFTAAQPAREDSLSTGACE
jgi:hypothetical protein